MSLRLKRFLFSNYGGFADKRVKDITKDYSFKIDDQSEDDIHERFCGISVRVTQDNRFILSLSNNAPINRNIKRLVESKGGEVRTINGYSHIEVGLSVTDVAFIRELSSMIKDLVAPGRRYKDQNWKWLCPRTAESLDNFANVLYDYSHE